MTLFCQKPPKVFDRRGTIEKVALAGVAFASREKVSLRFRFNSLGDYLQSQAASERDNRLNDCAVVWIVCDVAHKTEVDFPPAIGRRLFHRPKKCGSNGAEAGTAPCGQSANRKRLYTANGSWSGL